MLNDMFPLDIHGLVCSICRCQCVTSGHGKVASSCLGKSLPSILAHLSFLILQELNSTCITVDITGLLYKKLSKQSRGFPESSQTAFSVSCKSERSSSGFMRKGIPDIGYWSLSKSMPPKDISNRVGCLYVNIKRNRWEISLSMRSCRFASEQFLKRCEIHWGRVDSICSKSIFHRALYLESREVSGVYKRKVRCINKSFSLRF
ncbi:hypothetical protein CDAR_467221 [Caerostris darwini]|uniref:Uncharacterized protein n=1 Tax=Caerostris darwini TaxID=1538125 RepID=A0AAV4PCP3_9ARAC|nr:hypothetical protein CDAR_467221 [Caerostris darwini]